MKHCTTQFVILLLSAGSSLEAASTLYVNGGPLKSTDGGATWTQLIVNANNPLLPSTMPSIGAIATDPINPSIVYFIRTDHTAFYKSTDAGETWSAVVPIGFGFSYPVQPWDNGAQLAIDPVMTKVIYALGYSATANVILKSADSGSTWSPLPPVPVPEDAGAPSVAALATDPSTSGVLYALDDAYLFKTTNFGKTWRQIASYQTTGVALNRVFVDPSNNKVLYGASNQSNCGGPPNGFLCGLFKSSDGGTSWAQLNLPATEVDSVAFDPISGALYVGATVTGLGQAAMKSTDGGNTWTPLYNNFFSSEETGLSIKVDPNTPSTVYTLPIDGNRLYKSVDSGASWTWVEYPPLCIPNQGPSCTGIVSVTEFVFASEAPTPPPPPSISTNGVVNGASFQPTIVPNSWVTILGSSLASKTDDWTNFIVNGQFPTSVDGVSVTIGMKPAYVDFISPGQINLLAPDVGFGPLPLTVTTSAGTSATYTVTSSQYGPAFFEWPNAQAVATRQDFSWAVKNGTFPGTTTVPAKPGDVIILWGTGFGPTNPIAPAGAPVPSDTTYSTTTLPTVTVNNVAAMVFGAALAPGYGGLFQIAIQVPDSIPDGDWTVQATIGGVKSPTGVLLTVHE